MPNINEAQTQCNELTMAFRKNPLRNFRGIIDTLPTALSGLNPDDIDVGALMSFQGAAAVIATLIPTDIPASRLLDAIAKTTGRTPKKSTFHRDCDALHALTQYLAGHKDRIWEQKVADAFESIASRGDRNQLRIGFGLDKQPEILPFERLSPDSRVGILSQLLTNTQCKDEATVLQIAEAGIANIEEMKEISPLYPLQRAIETRREKRLKPDLKTRWTTLYGQIDQVLQARR